MNDNPLFRKYNVAAVQLDRQQKAKEAVLALPQEALGEDIEKLAGEIVASLAMTLPVLDLPNVYQTDREVQLDARRLPNRMVFDRSRPVPVPGTEITIHIPFHGDAWLFEVCPSNHNMNPPVAEIDAANKEILLIYQTAEAAWPIKARYEATVNEIQQHLQWLRPEIEETDSLRQVTRAEVAKRKQSYESHNKIVQSLGLPRRNARGA
jgi:hypothetical protein